MREKTDYIFVHCTATKPSQVCGAAEIDEIHKGFGWSGIGYHFVIRRDGSVELGRELMEAGAHVKGYNSRSVGVALEGGLNEDGKADRYGESYSNSQWAALKDLLATLHRIFPGSLIRGHRDVSPDLNGDGVIDRHDWMKECPCFDVRTFVLTHRIGVNCTTP